MTEAEKREVCEIANRFYSTIPLNAPQKIRDQWWIDTHRLFELVTSRKAEG